MVNGKIKISDTTLCHVDDHCSFKEKIDIITKLDSLGIDRIEVPAIENEKADVLLLHTVSPLVKRAEVFCGAGYSLSDLALAVKAVKTFKHPGITVSLPTSTVQMEFICHKKAPALLALCKELISAAKNEGLSVEFKAEDAGRSDPDFLAQIIKCAAESGASEIVLCDSTGTMLPDETSSMIKNAISQLDNNNEISVGIECSDEMSVSSATSFSAVLAGASLVKTTCSSTDAANLASFADLISKRGESLGISCGINYPILGKTFGEIKAVSETKKSELSPFDNGVRDNDGDSIVITADDSIEKVISFASSLGYELTDDDADKVYENVRRLAEKKPIGKRELEAVIASSAMQIPSTYTLKSYVINSGNIITATAHIQLEKNGETISGISVGDGPIDAAFLSIEQIIGRHFELDDFQIRAVTEGREAVGEALVKIRHNGKLFSGRGVSTDIIGASIRAYVKALNKICYEENK